MQAPRPGWSHLPKAKCKVGSAVNAGAMWVDQEVCVDHGLIFSRKPADIPAFNHRMIEEFAGGRHAREAGARTSRGASPRTH